MYFQIWNILQPDGLCPQKNQGKLNSSLWHHERLLLFPADQILFCFLACWLNVDWIVEYKTDIIKMLRDCFSRHLLAEGLAVCMGREMEKVWLLACHYLEWRQGMVSISHKYWGCSACEIWLEAFKLYVSFESPGVCFTCSFAAYCVL